MNLRIFDETLRDGEQQVGIVFSPDEKLILANEIASLGVHYIDIMPAVSIEEAAITENLIDSQVPVVPSVMIGTDYVFQAKELGAESIVLFTSTSEDLLEAKKTSLEENIAYSKLAFDYARKLGLSIDFAVEDATRSDLGYIREFAEEMGEIRYLILCDTIGLLEEGEASAMIIEFKKHYEGMLGVHFHNDKGLAVFNTVEAVLAGAELVSGTFTGIGERAGNANLEQTLTILKDHDFVVEDFDYDKMPEVCELVRKFAGVGPAIPGSREAFKTQTGIHVHAMLQDPYIYSAIHHEPEIWFGKFSGVSNYRWLFEHIHDTPLSRPEYVFLRGYFKARSIREKKSFSGDEVFEIYEELKSTPEYEINLNARKSWTQFFKNLFRYFFIHYSSLFFHD